MLAKVTDVQFCIDKAKEITELYRQYCLAPDDPIKSIDDLISVVRDYHNPKTLDIYSLYRDAGGSCIKGTQLVTAKGYEIYVLPGLEYHMNRLVTTKELFQTVLDTDRSRNGDIVQHLHEITDMFIRHESQPGPPALWEELAVISAVEFLYPYKDRRVLSSPTEIQAVSRRFAVPERYIEKYSSQYAMEFFRRFFESESDSSL